MREVLLSLKGIIVTARGTSACGTAFLKPNGKNNIRGLRSKNMAFTFAFVEYPCLPSAQCSGTFLTGGIPRCGRATFLMEPYTGMCPYHLYWQEAEHVTSAKVYQENILGEQTQMSRGYSGRPWPPESDSRQQGFLMLCVTYVYWLAEAGDSSHNEPCFPVLALHSTRQLHTSSAEGGWKHDI